MFWDSNDSDFLCLKVLISSFYNERGLQMHATGIYMKRINLELVYSITTTPLLVVICTERNVNECSSLCGMQCAAVNYSIAVKIFL